MAISLRLRLSHIGLFPDPRFAYHKILTITKIKYKASECLPAPITWPHLGHFRLTSTKGWQQRRKEEVWPRDEMADPPGTKVFVPLRGMDFFEGFVYFRDLRGVQPSPLRFAPRIMRHPFFRGWSAAGAVTRRDSALLVCAECSS